MSDAMKTGTAGDAEQPSEDLARVTAERDQWKRLAEHYQHNTMLLAKAEASLSRLQAGQEPVDMVLFCPACGVQHIDTPTADWPNPPHRSHLCLGCGHIWRPADIATNGVSAITTRGKADSPLAHPQPHADHSGEADKLVRGGEGEP